MKGALNHAYQLANHVVGLYELNYKRFEFRKINSTPATIFVFTMGKIIMVVGVELTFLYPNILEIGNYPTMGMSKGPNGPSNWPNTMFKLFLMCKTPIIKQHQINCSSLAKTCRN